MSSFRAGRLPGVLAAVCLALPAPQGALAESLGWVFTKRAIRIRFPEVPQLGVEALDRWLSDPERVDPLLLDVREPREYAVSHLRGAVSSPDIDAALEALADSPMDTPVVAYCSVGYRSSKLVQQLRERGYTRAMNLEGSIFEWVNSARPVYRDGQPLRQVHPYSGPWSRLLDPPYRYVPEAAERKGAQ